MKAQDWRFKSPLGPPFRRALIAGIPVGAMILLDLGLSAGQLAGLGVGALLGGFVAFDSPSGRTRAVWQVATAPFIAFAGALGALTSSLPVLAVVTMMVVASLAGLTFAISLRAYIAGASTVLALLIAQGLTPEVSDALEVFALAGAGTLLQAAFSIAASLADRLREEIGARNAIAVTRTAIAANLGLDSVAFRHALRWGIALGVGVAAYHLLDLGQHGYWVPLTILFVLRPSYGGDARADRDAQRGDRPRPPDRDAARRADRRRRRARRDRGRPLRGALLLPARDRVRALHRGDHGLRGDLRARLRPARAGGGRRARRRDRDRARHLRRRLRGLPRPARRPAWPDRGRNRSGGGAEVAAVGRARSDQRVPVLVVEPVRLGRREEVGEHRGEALRVLQVREVGGARQASRSASSGSARGRRGHARAGSCCRARPRRSSSARGRAGRGGRSR